MLVTELNKTMYNLINSGLENWKNNVSFLLPSPALCAVLLLPST